MHVTVTVQQVGCVNNGFHVQNPVLRILCLPAQRLDDPGRAATTAQRVRAIGAISMLNRRFLRTNKQRLIQTHPCECFLLICEFWYHFVTILPAFTAFSRCFFASSTSLR